ncbi:MAG: hypothetical protein NTU99_13755 [Pseudanabaena sp. LacPavin_0818_WC45_MAG_42_6]|nr:hypothetical protein [Pseudanabaena sp. LacPavin_0818_WC45_MAG_42_6]
MDRLIIAIIQASLSAVTAVLTNSPDIALVGEVRTKIKPQGRVVAIVQDLLLCQSASRQ